jgi:DNA-binding transcriptional MerR regulator
MTYTVKQLAELSGVSIRTLRFYDKAGILRPAYYGENGYRYYEQPQLLALQQILFLRELDMPLKDIRRILTNPNFNNINMLKSHKLGLEQKMERIKKLITTLDKTIATLNGECKINDREMYAGFDPSKFPYYDQIGINYLGDIAINLIAKRTRATEDWSKADWDDLIYKWNSLLIELTDILHNGLDPASKEAQTTMNQLYQCTKKLYNPTKEEYLAMCQINCNHPEYREQFDFYDPQLANYLEIVWGIFIERELS